MAKTSSVFMSLVTMVHPDLEDTERRALVILGQAINLRGSRTSICGSSSWIRRARWKRIFRALDWPGR